MIIFYSTLIILDNEEIVEAEHFLYDLNYTRIATVLNE